MKNNLFLLLLLLLNDDKRTTITKMTKQYLDEKAKKQAEPSFVHD